MVFRVVKLKECYIAFPTERYSGVLGDEVKWQLVR